MGVTIEELFGYPARDFSPPALTVRTSKRCPFLSGPCNKLLRDGTKSGVCTVQQVSSEIPTVCCPNRLYAQDYLILRELATDTFGEGVKLFAGDEAVASSADGNAVAVFGKEWGKELRLPGRKGVGRFFVDWILAKLDSNGKVTEFVAMEVQTIDTTGNYRSERKELMAKVVPSQASNAGLNWENVSKRILPQLIFKGHVLQREPLCKKGLFFVCPTAVYNKIMARLGGKPDPIHPQPGAITFRCYDLHAAPAPGQIRPLSKGGELTTTIQQVALAFVSPTNLPPTGSYLEAIQAAL
jgi:hypothetical protein